VCLRVIQASPAVTSKGVRAPTATGASIYIWYQREALEEKRKRRMTVMMMKATPPGTKEPRLKKPPLRRQ